ncbi:MAG TPA: alanine--tRNA ligase, partial [Anaerolineales bacterium]
GECQRYLELWNNVFIQYNRTGPDSLDPLPATHVDTGMGFERIVAVLQGVDSNYKIDLFQGALEAVRALTGDSREEMEANFTPYRVIADHARAAAFLIADGVVPGNVGRNYICRMIIRRAARFGTKLGLHEPFLAKAAEAIVAAYGDFYPELVKSRETILDNLTREEIRFARTVESGTAYLQGMLDELKKSDGKTLDGRKAFDLYATYGLPLEIARDIAREQGLEVDEAGFRIAMDEHRLASGGGKAMGKMGGEDAEFYAGIMKGFQKAGILGKDGVTYNSYEWMRVEGSVLALVANGQLLTEAGAGDRVEVLLPKTGFYIESGGQVSDTGVISAKDGSWEIEVDEMRKPSAGMIVHVGEVVFGHPKAGDLAVAAVDAARRHDIRRNHTATHLLHAALHQVLGENARQAGSSVTPDRFRFDFNHPEAMTPEEVEHVEKLVNEAVAADYVVTAVVKSREKAVAEGAMALFGEKYGDTVRTITIGDPFASAQGKPYSYELCGGTHLERTSDVGAFLIVSESSAAAGVRRIEAVTGRGAYELVAKRFKMLKQAAGALKSAVDEVAIKVETLLDELASARKEISNLHMQIGLAKSDEVFENNKEDINGYIVVSAHFDDVDRNSLRAVTDRFRQKYEYTGGTIIASGVQDDKPFVYTSSTDSEVDYYGIDEGYIAKIIGEVLGGSGGGRSTFGQAGGKDVSKLPEAREKAKKVIKEMLKKKKAK